MRATLSFDSTLAVAFVEKFFTHRHNRLRQHLGVYVPKR